MAECKQNITRIEFINFFNEFDKLSDLKYNSAYDKSNIYVSTDFEDIGLPKKLHILAIKYAIAHVLIKDKEIQALVSANTGYDVDELSLSSVKKATEGFVSIEKTVYDPESAIEADLLSTTYGTMLLNLLNQVQPPMYEGEKEIFPYYPAIGYGFDYMYPYTGKDKKE